MLPPHDEHLFVYGTLRPDFRHPMSQVLASASVFVAGAYVHARLFDLGDYPGMTLSDDPNDRVVGDLFKLKPTSAASMLRILDRYEGLDPTDPAPREYDRQIVAAHLHDGRIIPAWAYLLTASCPSHLRILSNDYLKSRG